MAQYVNGPEAENNGQSDLDILQADEDGAEETQEDEVEEEADDSEGEDEDDSEDSDSEQDEEEDDEDSSDSKDVKKEKKDEDDEEDHLKVGGSKFSDRPTYGQLKKEFPELFKKFPGLRNAFYRETEFTKRFPTVDDADEAIEQLNTLKEGEAKISSGDPAVFLDMLGNYDQNAQRKFVNNFLPTLYSTNRNAFAAITQPILKNVLRAAVREAGLHKNEDLQNSALHIHNFIFGDTDIEKGVPNPQEHLDKRDDPERTKFENERRQFLETRSKDFVKGVLDTSSRRINSLIEEGIPENATAFEKESFGNKVRNKLAAVLREDPEHISVMKRLHTQAEKAGFTKEFSDRASSAYLSRAKVALPAIIKEVKSEFSKGKNSSSAPPRRATNSNSRPPIRSSKVTEDAEKKVKSGKMSELDFLRS